MKKKELKDIKSKSVKELSKLVYDKKIEAKKAKLNAVSGKEKNLKIFKNLRRDIAQVKTIVREKQIMEMIEKVKEAKTK